MVNNTKNPFPFSIDSILNQPKVTSDNGCNCFPNDDDDHLHQPGQDDHYQPETPIQRACNNYNIQHTTQQRLISTADQQTTVEAIQNAICNGGDETTVQQFWIKYQENRMRMQQHHHHHQQQQQQKQEATTAAAAATMLNNLVILPLAYSVNMLNMVQQEIHHHHHHHDGSSMVLAGNKDDCDPKFDAQRHGQQVYQNHHHDDDYDDYDNCGDDGEGDDDMVDVISSPSSFASSGSIDMDFSAHLKQNQQRMQIQQQQQQLHEKDPNPPDSDSQKRRRTCFTSEQLLILEKEFHSKKYLSVGERAHLSTVLGLSESKIKIWFQNRRAKWKRVRGQMANNIKQALAAPNRLISSSASSSTSSNSSSIATNNSNSGNNAHLHNGGGGGGGGGQHKIHVPIPVHVDRVMQRAQQLQYENRFQQQQQQYNSISGTSERGFFPDFGSKTLNNNNSNDSVERITEKPPSTLSFSSTSPFKPMPTGIKKPSGYFGQQQQQQPAAAAQDCLKTFNNHHNSKNHVEQIAKKPTTTTTTFRRIPTPHEKPWGFFPQRQKTSTTATTTQDFGTKMVVFNKLAKN